MVMIQYLINCLSFFLKLVFQIETRLITIDLRYNSYAGFSLIINLICTVYTYKTFDYFFDNLKSKDIYDMTYQPMLRILCFNISRTTISSLVNRPTLYFYLSPAEFSFCSFLSAYCNA